MSEMELAKELQCLFSVVDTLSRPGVGVDEMLRAVADQLPTGFGEPGACRARVRFRSQSYTGERFRETGWMLRSPFTVGDSAAGSLEVALVLGAVPDGASPFTLEEKKLLDIVAQKVGEVLGRLEGTGGGGGAEPAGEPQAPRPEWQMILEVLAETDRSLHRRILRRLMNHLTRLGVPGVHAMILQFDPAVYADRDKTSRGANQPLPKKDLTILERLFGQVVRIASITLDADELSQMIKQWIRQDRMGFFALSIERRDISLVEVSDVVNRFCRDTLEEEAVLSPADDMNVRVALTRRLLTDSLRFIGIAKRHVSIHDFGRLLQRIIGPTHGNGKVGGKAAGLILASHVLRRLAQEDPLLEGVRAPHTWYIASDGLFDFVKYNSLEGLQSFKFSNLDEVRQIYPYLEQIFKHSFHSPEMVNQLKVALDDLGPGPLIVRSSSLLEDSEGMAFSGKYRSLFLVNNGTKEQRLEALCDAIAEVYASIFGPDPIQYRAERGLLDFMEEMGIIIQRVVGRRAGKYFFPVLAGVAFSNNEFRWSPRIRREDGVLRLVTGLGTRAVDRIGDDFPALFSPGQPNLRVNSDPGQAYLYAQRCMDVLNMETGRFESPEISEVLKEVGEDYPMLEKVFSVYDEGMLRRPSLALTDARSDTLIPTFSGLVEGSDFMRRIRAILGALQEAIGMPVDLEFAHDGEHLHILQCRPQSGLGDQAPVQIPRWVPEERKLFSADRYVTNGQVIGLRYVVYVDPAGYSALESAYEMATVAEVVGRLNAILPRRSFMLVGPGRWGSRGDITLGVGVTYSAISNTALLVEVARKKGQYVPDLSFGTHFFQDLVEANIHYLALYPDEPGILFNAEFFGGSPNRLAALLPEFAKFEEVVRVIDVEQVAPGLELHVLMDGERDHALGFLAERPKASGTSQPLWDRPGVL